MAEIADTTPGGVPGYSCAHCGTRLQAIRPVRGMVRMAACRALRPGPARLATAQAPRRSTR